MDAFWFILQALPFIFGVGIGVTLLLVGLYVHKKRKEAMQMFCTQHGYGFVESSTGHDEHYHAFEPFNRGSSRKARYIIRGERGDADFEVFQYQYTVQSGKNSTTHTHRVAVVQMPFSVQALSIKPEHFGHKIFDALGGEDLDFESDEFSRRFWVKADDRQQAYAILHPQMQEWLMRTHKVHLQWRGNALMILESGGLRIPDVHRMLTVVDGFRFLLPRHLLAEAAKP